MRVAINGVGIAGPTLAFWLERAGHDIVLIEQAEELRKGGYIIDFWGIGYDIAEKMGLIAQIRERGYQVEDVRIVDNEGKRTGGFAVDVVARSTHGRFTSVRRSDLGRIIYEALGPRVSTIFGDSIESITENDSGVEVGFRHAAADQFDLVVGADGLHSRVRELAFGNDNTVEFPIGYHVAAFELDGYRPRNELVYMSHSTPGKQVSRFSMRDDTTMFLFVFEDKYLTSKIPDGRVEQMSALRSIFGDVGWECPQILDQMQDADGIYFDTVSQIRMDRWSTGRVALVGDAGACVSLLAGEGTGLAMAEAYVLAGELARAGKDHTAAFRQYERLMMPFIKKKQASAAKFASSFAPSTSWGLKFRDFVTKLFRIAFIADIFIGMGLKDDLDLPDYDFRLTH